MRAQLPRGDLRRVMARHPMAGLELHQLRPIGVAQGVLAPRAAGVEAAAARRVRRATAGRRPAGSAPGCPRPPGRAPAPPTSAPGCTGAAGRCRGRGSRPPRRSTRGTSRRPGRRCAGPPRGRGRSPHRSGPSCSCRSSSRLITWACTDTSSADTGSSAMIRSGLTVSALAIPIRCRCPPENSCGYLRSALAGSPTDESSSRNRALVEALPLSRSCDFIPSTRIDCTDCRGSSEP